MNKVFEFRRNDNPRGRKVRIEVSLTDGVFTASCSGPTLYFGQCLDVAQKELNIKNPIFNEIIRLWKLYHLNDMHAIPTDDLNKIKELLK